MQIKSRRSGESGWVIDPRLTIMCIETIILSLFSLCLRRYLRLSSFLPAKWYILLVCQRNRNLVGLFLFYHPLLQMRSRRWWSANPVKSHFYFLLYILGNRMFYQKKKVADDTMRDLNLHAALSHCPESWLVLQIHFLNYGTLFSLL